MNNTTIPEGKKAFAKLLIDKAEKKIKAKIDTNYTKIGAIIDDQIEMITDMVFYDARATIISELFDKYLIISSNDKNIDNKQIITDYIQESWINQVENEILAYAKATLEEYVNDAYKNLDKVIYNEILQYPGYAKQIHQQLINQDQITTNEIIERFKHDNKMRCYLRNLIKFSNKHNVFNFETPANQRPSLEMGLSTFFGIKDVPQLEKAYINKATEILNAEL